MSETESQLSQAPQSTLATNDLPDKSDRNGSSHTAGPAVDSDAERLARAHGHAYSHSATVEEVPDEDDPSALAFGPAATSGSGKTNKAVPFDTKSTVLFPELGKSSKPVQAPAGPWAKGGGSSSVLGSGDNTDSASNVNGHGRAKENDHGEMSGAESGHATNTLPIRSSAKGEAPVAASISGSQSKGPPVISFPGQDSDSVIISPKEMLDRKQLKRPIPDLIRDFNKKSRVRITHSPVGPNHKFEATGPSNMTRTALCNFLDNVCPKVTHNVPIPASTRSLLIGRGGQNIRAIQERTGAHINIPKDTGGLYDDDATVDVTIHGNTASVASAMKEVNEQVGQHGDEANATLKDIPCEFYHFIAGPNNERLNHMQNNHNVAIHMPQYSHVYPAAHIPRLGPDNRPAFFAPHDSKAINIKGTRTGVQAARAAIESQVRELEQQLLLREDAGFERGQLQFIIDDSLTMPDFYAQTGCILIMPEDESDEIIRIVGPSSEAIEAALNKCTSRVENIPHADVGLKMFGGSQAHCWNVARYMRDIGQIARFEDEHNVRITTPMLSEGSKWGIFTSEYKNISSARSHIFDTIQAFPQSRMRSLDVDEFYHAHLRQQMMQELLSRHRVRTVVPTSKEKGAPLLLVFEGPSSEDKPFEVPRTKPTASQLKEFERGLNEAVREIERFIAANADIKEEHLIVPAKYHDKLRKFIKQEKESMPTNRPGLRVSQIGTTIKFRGLADDVDSLIAKSKEFIHQEEEYDKERGFTLSFEFPQKHANHLIGKGGQNVQQLREKFDVDINVKDGLVEIKGPKVKAEAARTNIQALARQLADETTHILKVDPKYHAIIIGSQGSQKQKLEDRYKVFIGFPPARSEQLSQATEATSDAGSTKPRKPKSAADEVTVRGPKKGADEARDEILNLVNYLREHSHEATIQVKQKHVPNLIGAGGRVMDEIRATTNARIDIEDKKNNRGGDDNELVDIHLQGTAEAVNAAKNAILDKAAVLDDMIVETIQVDRKHHRALIGTGGNALRDIIVQAGGPDDRREQSRMVRFPQQDSEDATIKVEGPKKVVKAIIAAFQDIVTERDQQVTVSIHVPTDKHRTIIGRGGDKKREIEGQFNVSIDVPRKDDGRTDVNITGRPGNVEQAKSMIEALVKETEGETIQVPRKLHHAIANSGRFFKDARNMHKVIIDHSGHKVPERPTATASQSAAPLITDEAEDDDDAHRWTVTKLPEEDGEIPWVLRGSSEGVAKVKEQLLREMEKASKMDTRGLLELNDTRNFRFVIGPGGKTIMGIRKETGCDIQVPRDDTSSGIVIVGSAAGVEQARDRILDAIHDGKASRRD